MRICSKITGRRAVAMGAVLTAALSMLVISCSESEVMPVDFAGSSKDSKGSDDSLTTEELELERNGGEITETPELDLKVNDSDDQVVVPKDARVELTWTTTSMESCDVWSDSELVEEDAESPLDIEISSDATLKLKCKDLDGESHSDTVSVEVTTPEVDLKINNMDGEVTVAKGSSVELTWEEQNSESCDLKLNGTELSDVSSPYEFSVETDEVQEFTIECRDSESNKATDSASVMTSIAGSAATTAGVKFRYNSYLSHYDVVMCFPGKMKVSSGNQIFSDETRQLTPTLGKTNDIYRTWSYEVTIFTVEADGSTVQRWNGKLPDNPGTTSPSFPFNRGARLNVRIKVLDSSALVYSLDDTARYAVTSNSCDI